VNAAEYWDLTNTSSGFSSLHRNKVVANAPQRLDISGLDCRNRVNLIKRDYNRPSRTGLSDEKIMNLHEKKNG